MFELVLNAMSPYPFLKGLKYYEKVKEYDIEIQYEVNDILIVIMFTRFYLLLNFILSMSQFMNPRSNRVCHMNKCEANFMFAIKGLMKQKPWSVLGYGITITAIMFGYILKIVESPLNEVSGQDFDSLWNCCWNVVITMTTVGYGDIYPKSVFGRVIGIIICFWGVFITSFFVVTITNMLQFSPCEDKAYNLLISLYFKA